tara:strand:- start:224 stop:697 length:474 start_codon:yes stop_codon:yes gene_type:complete
MNLRKNKLRIYFFIYLIFPLQCLNSLELLMLKEPIQTNKAPKAIGAYSQAIKSGEFLFISGQIPLNPETMEIVDSSFEDSAQRVISNLQNICKEAGASLDDIVKLNIYLLDLENFGTLNKIMEERFSEPFPARATVEVARLPKDVMIEMDAIVSLAQ